MKRFMTFIKEKVTKEAFKSYLLYTLGFTMLILGIYFYLVFAGQVATPKFTYAEF